MLTYQVVSIILKYSQEYKHILEDFASAVDAVVGSHSRSARSRMLINIIAGERGDVSPSFASGQDTVGQAEYGKTRKSSIGRFLTLYLVIFISRMHGFFHPIGHLLSPARGWISRARRRVWSQQRASGGFLDLMDKILVEALQLLQEDAPNEESAVADELSRAIAPLLQIRARIFLSSGNYNAAYEFYRAATAWRGDNNLGYIGIAAHLAGLLAEAEFAYRCAIVSGDASVNNWLGLGQILVVKEKEEEAVSYIRHAILCEPVRSMAHQNLAANSDQLSYTPQPFDMLMLPESVLYDALNISGERLVHIGRGDEGLVCFGKAIACQRAMTDKVKMPEEIVTALNDRYEIDPERPIRILPYEWVTLIGHIAMLDSYKKLQTLGMSAPGQAIVLAPQHKIANRPYLDLWRKHFCVIEDADLIEKIFPFQRIYGDCFNGYIRSDASPGDWTELGALGQIAWDAAGHGPLISIPDSAREAGVSALKPLGLSEDDWFVTLHVRDSGFHREGPRSMQMHRNASLEDYLPAVRAITEQGGWVVRMGDSSMRPFPKMERVIDYPHTAVKSPGMDVYLAAAARFFVGTTSGLTNAVISLGTPCLLVNCISNYFQLWNSRVLFTLKPIWNEHEGRVMHISEMVSEDFRWKIFNINQLARLGLVPLANTSEEIEQAVREMLDRISSGPVMRQTVADQALDGACRAGRNPHYFGNGRLSTSFYEARQADLFRS